MRFFTCDLFRVAEYFADLKSRLRNASLKNIILLNIPFSAFRVKRVALSLSLNVIKTFAILFCTSRDFNIDRVKQRGERLEIKLST